jgi:hypothetical protein
VVLVALVVALVLEVVMLVGLMVVTEEIQVEAVEVVAPQQILEIVVLVVMVDVEK